MPIMSNHIENQKKQECCQKRFFSEFSYPTYDEWKVAAEKLLKGKPFEKALLTKTYEGITLQPIYNQENIKDIPHVDSLPGFPPYVRGTKAEGHLSKTWDICQELVVSVPEEFNKVAKHDLERGQTVLNVVLDGATRRGFDPDQASNFNIGKNGLSVSTTEDIKTMLKDIDLETIPFFINAGATSLPLTALLSAFLKETGKSTSILKGCIGADPLGELAKEGSLNIELEKSYDTMASIVNWGKENASELNTILVDGNPYHNAGADGVSELAYVVATGVEYIRALQKRGLNIDEIATKMVFSFSLGSNFFMEIAKIRAARLVWSQIIKEFGGDTESQKMFIHGRTSSWTKTVYDPYVNMLRNTSEAFAGAIAGVDSLHVTPFDEPSREADDFSRRISRNVQSILVEECHFTQPIDPAGGSWYIEFLTNEIANRAWELFQEIEVEGGMNQALINGIIQKAIEEKAEEKFNKMAIRKHIFVGTNMYPNLNEKPLEPRNLDYDALQKERIETVQTYKMSNKSVESFEFSDSSDQLMQKAIEAVLSGATLGNISNGLHMTECQKATVQPLNIHRGAERFEALRQTAEDIIAKNGSMIKMFLVNMGPIPQHKARADFSTGFFEVGGFEVLKNNGFKTVDEAVEATLASGAPIAVICSTDQTYPELVPPIAKKLKEAKPEMKVIVAGNPAKDLEPVYREAGVDDFIHVRANCYELLSNLQKEVK